MCSNRLTGEIPSEFGDLISLEWFHLSDNEISGDIPAEIGGLSRLEEIFLNDNQLSGKIPEELGDLKNLEYLDLGSNDLVGVIPSELGQLTNLERLDLISNQLDGMIPWELSHITSLNSVKLQNNNLEGYEIGTFSTQTELANLYDIFDELNLSDNDLSSRDIDNILLDLLDSLKLEDRVEAEVYLTGNSIPSSEGREAQKTLEEEGWRVEVDERDEDHDDEEDRPTPIFWLFIGLIGVTIIVAILIIKFLNLKSFHR